MLPQGTLGWASGHSSEPWIHWVWCKRIFPRSLNKLRSQSHLLSSPDAGRELGMAEQGKFFLMGNESSFSAPFCAISQNQTQKQEVPKVFLDTGLPWRNLQWLCGETGWKQQCLFPWTQFSMGQSWRSCFQSVQALDFLWAVVYTPHLDEIKSFSVLFSTFTESVKPWM